MHGTAVTRSTKFRLTKFRLLDRLRIDITPYIPTQPSVSPITQSEALQMARRVYGEQSRHIFPRTITSELVSTTRRDRPWRIARGCEQGPFDLTRPLVNLRIQVDLSFVPLSQYHTLPFLVIGLLAKARNLDTVF